MKAISLGKMRKQSVEYMGHYIYFSERTSEITGKVYPAWWLWIPVDGARPEFIYFN
jgi:hypothetical protein